MAEILRPFFIVRTFYFGARRNGKSYCYNFAGTNKKGSRMIIERLSILNYKNIEQADLGFSRKMNCFIGSNGMGKTNVLDALYYLSFCKSQTNPIDAQVVRHGADFFMLQGTYHTDDGDVEQVSCGIKIGRKKKFKRNDKEYKRLAEHIGVIPLVLISPADSSLILEGSDERRRFIDLVISQYDISYLDALIRYGKALQQRNSLLKMESEPDATMLDVYEGVMVETGQYIHARRSKFVEELAPIFRQLYARIAGTGEEVSLTYISHCQRGDLGEQLREGRAKERIVGYTLHGTHKDELLMELGGFPVRKEGSQGQCKTYLIALKLAQFLFLKRTGRRQTPLLLLDDVFDKLDSHRVEQIVSLVMDDGFGQIFMTDTNREHLDRILERSGCDYNLFTVNEGIIHREEK